MYRSMRKKAQSAGFLSDLQIFKAVTETVLFLSVARIDTSAAILQYCTSNKILQYREFTFLS